MKITPELISHFERHEGKINHLYLDTKGYVTIGIGCMVSLVDCLSLPFMKETMLNATTNEIKNEYELIKSKPIGQVANYYSQYATLYLGDRIIEDQFKVRLYSFITKLGSVFPRFEQYNISQQEALLDMAYNLGISGLMAKFPTFCRAVKDENWELAAAECERVGISKERNMWTMTKLVSVSVQA